MKEITNRKKQAIETKEKIYNISIQLIKEHGYDNVKITTICEKAGVSVGSFYHHFKNKAGIVIELYSICDIYFSETVLPTLLKTSNSYCNKIIEYIASQMQYVIDIGNDCSTQLYKAQITDGNEFFLSMERGLPNGLCYLVQCAQTNGELERNIAAIDLAKEILIISRGILYNWCVSEGTSDIIYESKRMISNYLTYYKTKKQ
ncbi:TetR/AcrR family transcriptional regulator [Clostridium sp.]|uniref:TetR/AcrR family transcriptional regulator n=1 Tax=Clostridium sp. TaxID=1506 RepID=UPI003D6D9268